jgi:hypothetical protein
LYLADDLVPVAAVRFCGRRKTLGRWVTSAVRLATPAFGRAFTGPDVFFRQMDLGAREAWLAPLLMSFAVDVEMRDVVVGGVRLHEWELRGDRYYYEDRARGRWALHGGGNTSAERLEQVLRREAPSSVGEFLWAVGAIKLG